MLTPDEKLDGAFDKASIMLQPPTDRTVSQWADDERFLPSSTSAEPGKFRSSRFPFMVEIADSLSSQSLVNEVALMKGAQISGTETCTSVLGYYMAEDPCPILCVQPTVDLAQRFSKTRIVPLIENSPTLKGKVKESKSRDSGNTILQKEFPGGILMLAGANSAAGLRSASIRILLLDEVDGYPQDVEGEGDPVDLAKARTITFARRKVMELSTPTTKGVSRIEASYENTDKRRYFVPCPECGEFHILEFKNFVIPTDGAGNKLPEQAYMACPHCGSVLKEKHKTIMLRDGVWRPTRPEGINPRKRGYHISAFYSPLGFLSWAEIAQMWIDAQKDQRKLKVFVNTILGETWEEQGEDVEIVNLESRREYYGTHSDGCIVVPDEVLILTAAVDVQDSRLEAEIVGWAAGERSWGIDYRVFMGSPGQKTVWDELDAYLQRAWHTDTGYTLKPACVCIDSGGHFATEVYDFVKPKENRRVFAIKGRGGLGVPLVGKHTRGNRANVALFPVGDDTGKETVLNRLKIVHADDDGYCHFPRDPKAGYDADYFESLTSERRVIRYHKGKPRIEWVKKSGARNEALDIRKYATAALEIVNPDFSQLAKQREVVNPSPSQAVAPGRRVISKGVE